MLRVFKLLIAICFLGLLASCEDYLDKSIETELTKEEVFKNFDSAQGFVEEMYAMIVDYSTAAHWQHFHCYGEDAVGIDTWQFDYAIDEGRYWAWQTNGPGSMFDGPTNTNADLPFDRAKLWPSSWAGIRKANIVIADADNLMADATQEEKNAILGQAYFFRAFFHHEIMKFWGSIPYIDRVLEDDWRIPRPAEWSETALKIDEDFQRAVDLLPVDWDDPDYAPGEKSRGQNMFRITKGAALSLKAKNLLYAASPLMQNSSNTYDYDVELAKRAADTFAEVIKMPRYSLVPWEDYESVFYSTQGRYPYTSEFIFSQAGDVGWFHTFLPTNWQLGAIGQNNLASFPTHNYIHNYFGMNDGLACDDSPLYDPANPWENRDPRLYKWIVLDGDQMVENLGAATGENEVHRYAQFYTDGAHRYPNKGNGTRTGYVAKKWFPISFNNFDNQGVFAWRVHVRLTDVYLMYAEAALVAYGINGKPNGFDLSALDAINRIRERAVPDGSLNVRPEYLVSEEAFMDEIRRERAVELSYESHRWMDVRRWKLGTELKYKLKTEIVFDRNAEGKPINFVEKVLRTKVFEDKHYWLPFPKNDTEIYEGFPQNPGW
ncbi:RagB/SusD family nutrient uptake outer membrane protein [Pseudozobellia thermophila]|uniref:Starch-binding associating with outer membrane n=1 Tax=Pseudozobellia thermophila TaxID=192903 RepID=A0A1M6FTS3_9FLAO|nr:RagB/SusD family nutrient uptake outer membrane protein [Pseudozobellia thermophila]SHJ01111.1 Starch-binding associating with outer membrane [Pseudozobellia thermophila]